ncbi:MAG: TnsA endonuclease N-terminal domain-containing protein [Candidimonas sp.]
MARTYNQDFFEPKNPEKYLSGKKIFYKSAWELTVMRMLDEKSSILAWQSEPFTIYYLNPLTKKWKPYIPDFFVIYENKKGQKNAEVWELKPMTQTGLVEAKTRYDRAQVVINQAKWSYAVQWCSRKGYRFRVITENDIYRQKKK